MASLPAHRRVVLARAIAARYLVEVSRPEYRLSILTGSDDRINVPSVLAGFRAGRIRLAGTSAPSDLGLREEFDSIVMWSSDADALGKVAGWFESRGFETSGVH
jgi:hypothetical protein